MPDLLAGQIIRAADFPPSVYVDDATDLDNQTNTTWAPGTPSLSMTFTAPTTGRARIDLWTLIDEDADGGGVRISAQVRKTNATGPIVYEPGTGSGMISEYWVQDAPSSTSAQGLLFLSGLEPGAAYWVQMQHQIVGTPTGALDVVHRAMLCQPLT